MPLGFLFVVFQQQEVLIPLNYTSESEILGIVTAFNWLRWFFFNVMLACVQTNHAFREVKTKDIIKAAKLCMNSFPCSFAVILDQGKHSLNLFYDLVSM